MKRSHAIFTFLAVVTALATITALVIIFREQLELFLSEMRDKYIAAREDMFTPDEYSDYADID